MAITLVTAIKRFVGLSSDTKPTVTTEAPIGSTFYETDTGEMYILNTAGSWVIKGEHIQLTGRTTAIAGAKTVTTAGNPEALSADQACGEGIIIEAMETNTDDVYVFPSAGAKTDVKPLSSGDITVWPVSNLNALKIDSEVSGEGVYWKGAV